jgi:hypothetical protein
MSLFNGAERKVLKEEEAEGDNELVNARDMVGGCGKR